MNADEVTDELIQTLRALAANREQMAAGYLGLARVMARDVVLVASLAPGDPLRDRAIRGARQRAQRVLDVYGDDERAH